MRALRVGNLARATAIVSTALLFSRVLGLVRTTLFAATFGGASASARRRRFHAGFYSS